MVPIFVSAMAVHQDELEAARRADRLCPRDGHPLHDHAHRPHLGADVPPARAVQGQGDPPRSRRASRPCWCSRQARAGTSSSRTTAPTARRRSRSVRSPPLLLGRIFLGEDDLDYVEDTEACIRESQALVILLGSELYFTSKLCLQELEAAKQSSLQPICVHEPLRTSNGAPLAALTAVCPPEHREFVFEGGEIIVWHQSHEFQLVALTQIAERMMATHMAYPGADLSRPTPLYVNGSLASTEATFADTVALYVSSANPDGAEVARDVRGRFGDVHRADDMGDGVHWLLHVSTTCFEGTSVRCSLPNSRRS